MSKKFVLIFCGLVFFLGFSHIVHAEVSINEIMYDSDGGDIDWVEILNNGSTDVDLTSLKLLVSNSSSNHAINNSSGSSILHSGDYGVIVATASLPDYKTKWGSSGNIFTSSFSLPNDTAKIEINAGDKLSPISSVTYASTQGASGDGNSLQNIAGSWIGANPTPNAENSSSASTPTTTDPASPSTSGGIGSYSSTSTSTTQTKDQKITAKILVKNISFVSLPLTFEGDAFSPSGEKLYAGKYFWNFGDGDSKEVTDNKSFTHNYLYPGDYAVSMEYYVNNYTDTPEVTSKVKIKVVPMALSISRVGDAKDYFVELANGSAYDMDLSGWSLSNVDQKFILPRNTNIFAKSKITFSSSITHFTKMENQDNNTIKLYTPDGEIAGEYDGIPPTAIVATATPKPVVVESVPEIKTVIESKIPTPPTTNFSQNLTASTSNSVPVSENSNHNYIYAIILVIFLVLSGGGVYFIRQNSIMPQAKEDFEILDE